MLKTRIELHFPAIAPSCNMDVEHEVQFAAHSFKHWFGNASIIHNKPPDANNALCVYCIIWSFCTTDQLRNYIQAVEALAKKIANHLSLDNLVIIINNYTYVINV